MSHKLAFRFVFILLIVWGQLSMAQQDRDTGESLEAVFTLQQSFELNDAYGVEFDGSFYYVTDGVSNQVRQLDLAGNLIDTFTIPGAGVLLDLAYDGTYMYGGGTSSEIFQMDFSTQTIAGAIPVPGTIRHIAYDESADAFWMGNANSNLFLIDRSGTIIRTIFRTVHNLLGMNGSAYDAWSSGGPYLWIFHRQAAGQPPLLSSIRLSTGQPTGISYNTNNDLGEQNAPGGLFALPGTALGASRIGGISQAVTDKLFIYQFQESFVPPLETEITPTTLPAVIPPEGGSYFYNLRVTNIAPNPVSFDAWVYIVAPDGEIITALMPRALSLESGVTIVRTRRRDIPSNAMPGVYVAGLYVGIAPNVVFAYDTTRFTKLSVGESFEKTSSSSILTPFTTELQQNYPNPFNPSTTIRYQLREAGAVELVVYNTLGQQVALLVNEYQAAGAHQAVWDARDQNGRSLPSGIYLYRLRSGEFVKSHKMLLAR